MLINGIAKIRHNPLTEPGNQVETKRREKTERHCHEKQADKVFVDTRRIFGQQAKVNEITNGDGQSQLRCRGQQ